MTSAKSFLCCYDDTATGTETLKLRHFSRQSVAISGSNWVQKTNHDTFRDKVSRLRGVNIPLSQQPRQDYPDIVTG